MTDAKQHDAHVWMRYWYLQALLDDESASLRQVIARYHYFAKRGFRHNCG